MSLCIHIYRVVQLNLALEINVFHLLFDRSLSILFRHLSNSIWNSSISGVKSSWTSLYSICNMHILTWDPRSVAGYIFTFILGGGVVKALDVENVDGQSEEGRWRPVAVGC